MAKEKWYYNVWFVLAMLFLILGPFGLPLVWKHPRFSTLVKVVLTLAVGAYTLLLVEGTVKIAQAVLGTVEALNQTMTPW